MRESGRLCSEKGYFVKDSIVLACDILECTPWLEFGDADLTFSEPDVDSVPAVPPLPWPLDEDVADTASAPAGTSDAAAACSGPAASAVSKGGKETAISRLLNLAGLQLSTAPQAEGSAAAWGAAAAAGATVHIQVVLQEKLAEDEELLQSFCNGMRAYLQVCATPCASERAGLSLAGVGHATIAAAFRLSVSSCLYTCGVPMHTCTLFFRFSEQT